MFNWLWRLLGYHVCEEFTRWEDRLMSSTRSLPKALTPSRLEAAIWRENSVSLSTT